MLIVYTALKGNYYSEEEKAVGDYNVEVHQGSAWKYIQTTPT